MNALFTVLIAEKEHIDAIRQGNKLFFEPFLKNHELAFCDWNPQGQTLHESVPGLIEMVGRKKDWRAVIIHSGDNEQLKLQNPFDCVDDSSLSEIQKPHTKPMENEDWSAWEEAWNHYYQVLRPRKESVYREAMRTPLTKLATWLCFQPAEFILEDVVEKKSAFDSALRKVSDEEVKPSARLEQMEEQQYRFEQRLKEQLRRELFTDGGLNIARPAEVYCISQRITEDGFFSPKIYWDIHSSHEYSEFYDRNMYCDKMRFLVFDVLPATHQNYRCDKIRFLYNVMVFASNPIPGSALQARKLYVLESENDDTPLCTLATSYHQKLGATFDIIENEIEQIRSDMPGELSDKEADALFCIPLEVPVSLDKTCEPDRLITDDQFGLYSDRPTDERAVWTASQKASQKELDHILRHQGRTIKKSVDRLGTMTEVPGSSISRLNSFQMDDIRDMTETIEDEMMEEMPPSFDQKARYSKEISSKKTAVRNVLERRMGKTTTISLLLFSLFLYFICFLPFLFSNMDSADAKRAAWILTGGMLLVVAVILVVTLFCLRMPLKDAVSDYNLKMEDILREIKDTMGQYSRYLSAICNVRRGNYVLNYAEKNPDEYTKSIRIRRKHQADIRKKQAFLTEQYRDFICGASYYDHAMMQPYDYDFGQKIEYDYPAPFLAGDCHRIEFMESGNYVTVPSGYVTRISVKMEEIYDE